MGNQLGEISRDLAPRRIVIPAAPNVALARTLRSSFHDPDWPGKVEITCIDAQDLLGHLMELAQASGGTLV